MDAMFEPTSTDMGMMDMTSPSPTDTSFAPAQSDPFQGMQMMDNSSGECKSAIPEVSALREWESKHNEELMAKEMEETTKKNELRAQAAAEIAKWKDERNANIKKTHDTNLANQEALAQNDCGVLGATTWERVVNLIDLNARASDESRDTSRMRNLLIQLKSSPPVKAN
mmetsp:Transcript_108436/g.171109  ORF Transcript_108436/g.171109 Transcript_108436/m.171109 type:complete len:169 (+) Transcript_108436:110-616(+)